jgi:hypothetical protein
MNRTIVSAAMVIPAALIVSLAFGAMQQNGNQQKVKDASSLDPFMQLKLVHSKDILEGLATEDFEMIAKGAQSLTALSLESSWNVYTTEKYLQQSSDFRQSLKIIKEGAHEKNIDRAALGYLNMTVQCLECHRYLKTAQTTDKNLVK